MAPRPTRPPRRTARSTRASSPPERAARTPSTRRARSRTSARRTRTCAARSSSRGRRPAGATHRTRAEAPVSPRAQEPRARPPSRTARRSRTAERTPVRCSSWADSCCCSAQRFTFASARGNLAAMSSRKIRVAVAKPGLDGHDRGAKIIARALRDAGMEVIYTGLHQTPEQIAETAIQEDADAVGLSILSGAHMTLVPRVVSLLREQDAEDVLITVGGTIPADDIPELKRLGGAEVFTPGAPTDEIVEVIRGAVR